jgi:transcriptional regulator with XRE-family HTH domain
MHTYIGKKIKELRRKEKLTQSSLGELLGLTRTSIINIEAGKHHLSIEKLYILCSLFKVEYSFILPEIKPVNLESSTLEIVKVKLKKVYKKVKI